MTIINNKPTYADEHLFIVARYCDDELWFWGAYDDAKTAYQTACEIGGVYIERGKVIIYDY